MDIESDDSERWEDFFGSSTELAPSLLGIYDTLTSALDVNCNSTSNSTSDSSNIDGDHNGNCNKNNKTSSITSTNSNNTLSDEKDESSTIENEEQQQQKQFELSHQRHQQQQQQLLPLESETDSNCSRDSSLTLISPTTPSHTTSTASRSLSSLSLNSNSPKTREYNTTTSTTTATGNKHRNNIRILSANVQRIITHSDAEPVDSVDIEALQAQSQSPILSPILQHRFTKKTASSPINGHKVKLSNIPLSKITGKLTQSGSDLVETFDSSSEYLDALNFTQQTEKKIQPRTAKPVERPTPAAPATLLPSPPTLVIAAAGVDDEKTPTNIATPFSFDAILNRNHKFGPRSDSQESIKLIEMEKLATTTTQLLNNSCKTNRPPTAPKEFVPTAPLSPCEIVEAFNYTLITKNLTELSVNGKEVKASSETSVEVIEAVNKPIPSAAVVSAATKHLVRSSSAACASTVAGSPLLTYARSKSLAAKANTLGGPVPIKLPTAEQLEELEEASKMSAESLDRLTDIKSKFSPKESRKISSLMLPEIAKLKHRPLSSSSICSTSSSSSSGSDQLNGKLATSYLASVESLADQSESELMDPHTGMSIFERACMEIVDSERSYVEDLGQVIRGYLLDWKERACLRYDELRILFSNIEEIYDFNSTLLKQLINSGMDPVKIAKCFIDLRERFDVYTTYCTSYPEAISLLTKLLQATHTNALLTSTQKMLQHTLPLGSYLLKPVQRILKYHLLLDNLRKHSDIKEEVFHAYEIMRQVARNIDQVKRKLEQQSRVKELSGILDGWLGPELTVLGELRQEGLLMEHNKPRMVFLFATMLIITKPKEDSRLQFKSYIHQNNLMLSEHLPGEPTSFYVIPYDEPRNQIKLTAKNRDQKRLWAQHIKGVILEKFDNIPNRAKELVYKLGDEEDRTPDKNTWKWSLHSASTPVYLERRNQYRRSEMRNRSKFKRKTVANSSSFDSFNEIAENTPRDTASATKSPKSLSRNNSMDDNMLPALQKLAAAVKSKNKSEQKSVTDATDANDIAFDEDHSKCEHHLDGENCSCILRGQRSVPKSPIFGGKSLKERSKSVPRISFQTDAELQEERNSIHSSSTNLDARKSKSTKSIEVKQYNNKTMPKRIATLKKQRSNKKETSTFYMDLSEFEDAPQTVLKITESTENLIEKEVGVVTAASERKIDEANSHQLLPDVVTTNSIEHELNEILSPAEKAKKDAQIILDLLKHNKEFERIYKKPQKKRSIDNGSTSEPTSPEPPQENKEKLSELPPRPPSRSPPPLESDPELTNEKEKKTKEENSEVNAEEEPIYETLLRNVHVPYKFSPVLGRSKSAQYYKPREKKPVPMPRPESDYVTLVYSPEGMLQKVGDDTVGREQLAPPLPPSQLQRESSNSSKSSSSNGSSTDKRESQNTVVNVECLTNDSYSQLPTTVADPIYARAMPKNLLKRLLSSNGSSESSLLPQARKSIENISLAFARSNKPPERRVSDVSEMCRQSVLHRQGSEAVGERMAHVDYADPRTLFSVANSEASLQRDSVFSLTSSNDSVCDHKRSLELSTNFEYEYDVEASLENDFRDSAIYSDDNEKRVESGDSSDCIIKRSSSPMTKVRHERSYPQVPPKPLNISPLIVKSPSDGDGGDGGGGGISPSVIICPPHLSPNASRSWVLQQIENFNK